MAGYVPTKSHAAAAVAQDFQGGHAEVRSISNWKQVWLGLGGVIVIVSAVLLVTGGR
ncbi:MAG TPA: hypothetical protein VG102_00180 [Candidatus Paceibacterota bacterium]|nr:hypothetical protein [Candidatus Paceibacterota bacterium]